MKKFLFAIAAVAMFFATSCKKENINEPVNQVEPVRAFTCTIDNGAVQNIIASGINDDMSTMTTIPDGRNIFWKSGDQISVNGLTYTATSISQGQAEFTNADATPESPYYAFYPNIHRGTGQSYALVYTDKGTFPQEIAVDKNNNAAHLPMFAYGSDTALVFHNICAVLELHIPADKEFAMIEMKADQNLYGNFTVNNYATSTPYAVLDDASSSTKTTLVIKPVAGQSFTANSKIYVAIPAGITTKTYTNVSFEMIGTDVDSTKYVSGTLSSMPVVVNTIYPAELNVTVKGRDYAIRNNEFCFKAPNGNATISFPTSGIFEYLTVTGTTGSRVNSGWSTYNGETINLTNANDSVCFKAVSTGNTSLSSKSFVSDGTGTVTVSGKLAFLYNASDNADDPNVKYAFRYIFRNMTNLTDASGLTMPHPDNTTTQLQSSYFESAFEGCTQLVKASFNLPSTNFGGSVYKNMFKGCSALTSMPTFGDVTSYNASACYGMFQNCTALDTTTTIKIKGNVTASNAFQYMFNGCSSLTRVNIEFSSSITCSTGGSKSTPNACTLFNNWLPDNTGTIHVSGGAKKDDFTDSNYSSSQAKSGAWTHYYKLAYQMNQTAVTPENWQITVSGNTDPNDDGDVR